VCTVWGRATEDLEKKEEEQRERLGVRVAKEKTHRNLPGQGTLGISLRKKRGSLDGGEDVVKRRRIGARGRLISQ